ncbi:hypothetical protein [Gordonia amicalis]|uniref:hypothetical protein n=1 Tax=Gordonia amicalis TaxID=89053 RepID=UPI0015F3DD96|nr:hypothetical protein [Gordonia amicalis]MBA5849255.1 hypothetical protein [Gordonia amicalis]
MRAASDSDHQGVHPWWSVAAAIVSAALGVGAHGLAGGGTPTPSHAVLLLAISAGLGWVLNAGLADRVRGRASAALSVGSALATAQLFGHLAMRSGDHHAVTPGPTMLLCHLAALAAAAVLLVGAEECSRRVGSRIIAAISGERSIPPRAVLVVAAADAIPLTPTRLSGNPTRGPPIAVR